MSNFLLKKGLGLFDDDSTQDESSGKKKVEKNSDVQYTNKQGIKKEQKKLRRKQEQAKQFKVKKRKTMQDEWLKYQSYDNTEDNLQVIAKLTAMGGATCDVTAKVLEHSSQKKKKPTPEQNIKNTIKEESIFTDGDFEKFAKEYDTDFWGKD